MEFRGRSFLCSANALAAGGEMIVVMHDITELKNVEQMKKDFASNISHELRTPLTAIKGFVETMQDEATSQQKHYLSIVARHTERLIHIVEDLLLLSKLEDREQEPLSDKVSLAALIADSVALFSKKAEDKGISLVSRVASDMPSVCGDAFKLEQALINLIDNAVKYSDKGSITITAEHKNGSAIISVQDTGTGIPAEHLPRIFERFYVVDKSRTRTLGGTGLGLSIVKHIVLLHNGTIKVDSIPGAGSTFTISLPLCQ